MKYTFILNAAGVVLSLGSLHTPHGTDVHPGRWAIAKEPLNQVNL